MNAKTCKQIRKFLRRLHAQQVAEGQVAKQHAYYELEARRPFRVEEVKDVEGDVVGHDDKGVELQKIITGRGQLVVSPGTVRGRYLALKAKVIEKSVELREVDLTDPRALAVRALRQGRKQAQQRVEVRELKKKLKLLAKREAAAKQPGLKEYAKSQRLRVVAQLQAREAGGARTQAGS